MGANRAAAMRSWTKKLRSRIESSCKPRVGPDASKDDYAAAFFPTPDPDGFTAVGSFMRAYVDDWACAKDGCDEGRRAAVDETLRSALNAHSGARGSALVPFRGHMNH